MIKVAIIGGSGFHELAGLRATASETVGTPYGEVDIALGRVEHLTVGFLPRHGRDNRALPHLINYRANIWALKEWGATRILANTTVGSLNPRMRVGDFIVLDQFIDFLRRGPLSFELGHVDMTSPYCEDLRRACFRTAVARRTPIHRRGVYLCCDGPRYETAAEIRAFRRWGADVVGMTHAPEAVLARELGLCYAAVALVVNVAAGLKKQTLSYDEHRRRVRKYSAKVGDFLLSVLPQIPERPRCRCAGLITGRE